VKKFGRNGRDLLVGLLIAAALAFLTWGFVRGIALCPRLGELAGPCHNEADQLALRFAAAVGGFIALTTIAIVLFNRSREG
jgi:hypothetical protein